MKQLRRLELAVVGLALTGLALSGCAGDEGAPSGAVTPQSPGPSTWLPVLDATAPSSVAGLTPVQLTLEIPTSWRSDRVTLAPSIARGVSDGVVLNRALPASTELTTYLDSTGALDFVLVDDVRQRTEVIAHVDLGAAQRSALASATDVRMHVRLSGTLADDHVRDGRATLVSFAPS